MPIPLAEFTWTHELDTWIVVAGALSAMACALLGNYLLLRRMSLMGDAISHAILPGLAVAFFITGSRNSVEMFVGAGLVGVLTAVLTEWVRGFGRVDASAAMGVVFTALFAAGLVLIAKGAHRVDLDPGCVLYGDLVSVPMDMRLISFGSALGGFHAPRAVITLSIVFVLNIVFVLLFYKELKITSFDPALATALGINARVMHYALVTLVAITTVAAFESVGSILVIAMLIVPPAIAHLLTERLSVMLVISVIVGAMSAALGHVGAITVPTWVGFEDASTAGMIAVAAGALFLTTMLLAPRHGLVSKWVHRARLAVQVTSEDVLGVLFRFEEFAADGAASRSLPSESEVFRILSRSNDAGPLVLRLAIRGLNRSGQIARRESTLQLSDSGRTAARQILRSHRLWESYLARYLHLPTDHLHPPAEQLEHVTTTAMREQLARDTNAPDVDPQGRPVPPA